MKGDVLVLEPHHREAARVIAPWIRRRIAAMGGRLTVSVSGESGSGKSETALAIAQELEKSNLNTIILGQDDYFVLPPRTNDARRRSDPEWLGPHVEVRLDLLDQNLRDAIAGEPRITKPLVDYDADSIEEEVIDLAGADLVIAEGTYTSLLKHVDTRIFIARSRVDTLEHRQKRARGNEVGDPFIEEVLKIEHKIIAGHRKLADIVITKDYDVLIIDEEA
jgi:uridine kinase